MVHYSFLPNANGSCRARIVRCDRTNLLMTFSNNCGLMDACPLISSRLFLLSPIIIQFRVVYTSRRYCNLDLDDLCFVTERVPRSYFFIVFEHHSIVRRLSYVLKDSAMCNTFTLVH